MNGRITYHQQVSYCGKERCRKCREGIGHGPYWYAYQTVNGHTTRTYIGKHLPPEVQASIASPASSTLAPTAAPGLTPELETTSLRIYTLGQFRLERRSGHELAVWQPVTDIAWKQSQVRSLLGYLLTSPERKLSRQQIIETLRPGGSVDTRVAMSNLHRLVHRLRQILGHQRSGQIQEVLLHTEGEWLVLADQSRLWVDADAFEALLVEARRGKSRENSAGGVHEGFGDSTREQLLKNAVTLYRGDFLPEERQSNWVLARRQSLRRSWAGLLLDLADVYLLRNEMMEAMELLDRLLASDGANEAAVQRLMIVLAQLKRRGEALRAYHRLEDILRRDYHAQPSEETRALYEAVRQGDNINGLLHVWGPGKQTSSGIEQLKGKREAVAELRPVPLHQINRTELIVEPAEKITMPTGRHPQSPLIGREREMEALHLLLQAIEQGAWTPSIGLRRTGGLPLDTQRRPQCIVLKGEAGIGKTRLAEEISREVQLQGWTVVWGRAFEQESGIPYRLWTNILRRLLNSNVGTGLLSGLPSSGPAEPLQEAQLRPLAALLPELAPLSSARRLASGGDEDLVGVGVQEHGRRTLHVQQEQLHLQEATLDLLARISGSAPLLIVLDDIQWADNASCDLMGYLARHLYGLPIVLLATCRETELPVHPQHPLLELIAHMQREHTIRSLELEPLTSEQIGKLVGHLPAPVVQHIQKQAAGNPFFAEEMASTPPPSLPQTVAGALEHRMSKLSNSCQKLLCNAAILGGSFQFPEIYAMESTSMEADEDTVLSLIEEALQSRVLAEEGSGTQYSYHFWHPLMVSYLYEQVSATRRARLHKRAAEMLQRMHRGRTEEVAATITHHLVKSGAEPAEIAHYAEIAGDRAYALSGYAEVGTTAGYAEAVRYYKLALEQLELVGRDEEPKHRIYLLERLAECTMIRGSFTEARHLYERLLELRKGNAQYLIERVTSPVREAEIQALLWSEIAWTWRYTGDSEQARVCCKQGEQVLRDAGVVTGPAWARLLYQRGHLYWYEGLYQEAWELGQQAIALFEEVQKPVTGTLGSPTAVAQGTRIQRSLQGDPVDLGLAYKLLAGLALYEGRLNEALEYLNTALAIFEQCDNKRRIAHISCDLGHVYLKKAEYQEAQASLRRSLNLAERIGEDPLIAVVASNLGELAACSKEYKEAEDLYKRAIAQAEQINDREYISLWNVGLATVFQEQGRLDEAAVCVRRALRIGRAINNHPCIGGALVALGNLRIAQSLAVGKFSSGHKRLLHLACIDARRALALTRLGAETRIRGQLVLAQVSSLTGDKERARKELNLVSKDARHCHLKAIEAQAKNLLNELANEH
ncbi:tetratricopeptide repeat protein [Ktedonosporobacter rubrisoli]|uniref:Tetratricopeptide repeat protein n=1 Tax=Ktedonosporobacter rubrisoli TaxID=2509675 RepID=A0A4P6K4Z7_KTERU|nr:tetratricopeptide repeat protein [Ktedonosporobacter rubrisoli]QBD83155.1 tetratricopeptide repeat protein [Ktedonosporobacter rubrisoli]